MDWRHLLQEVQQGNWQALLIPEVAMLTVGCLLMLIGARVYRIIIIAPGFICGALLAKEYISGSSEVQLIVTLVLGIIGAILFTSIEKLAISMWVLCSQQSGVCSCTDINGDCGLVCSSGCWILGQHDLSLHL